MLKSRVYKTHAPGRSASADRATRRRPSIPGGEAESVRDEMLPEGFERPRLSEEVARFVVEELKRDDALELTTPTRGRTSGVKDDVGDRVRGSDDGDPVDPAKLQALQGEKPSDDEAEDLNKTAIQSELTGFNTHREVDVERPWVRVKRGRGSPRPNPVSSPELDINPKFFTPEF